MEKTEAFMRGGTYLKNKDNRIAQIEVQMMNIIDMQKQLITAITDLTNASAVHQIASTVVSGVLYIRAFLSASAGYTLMRTKEAVTIVSKNGFRGTVIKNFSDFATAEAKREAVKCLAKESIQSFGEASGKGLIGLTASKLTNSLTSSSELGLYLDAIGSGRNSLDQLYQMNDKLDKEYNQLCAERSELKRH